MRKVRILLSTAVMLLVLSLCGCGKKVVTYTTEDYISVSVSGVNGEGRLSVQTGSDEFFQKVNNDVFEGKASEIDLASMTVNIAAYAEYNVSSSENLSNGDTVTITMSADNESLRELGLEFALDEYVYTVSGLAEPQELDVWTGLDVTFTGISPDGSAEAVYNGSDPFVKENVRYIIDSAWGLSNGDTVKVTASCSQSVLDENNYVLSETEKTFTVEGLSFYPADLNGYDLSDIDDTLMELARKKADKSTYMDAYNSGSRVYGSKIFPGGSAGSKEWSVTGEYTIEPVHRYVLSDTEGSDANIYTVFYSVTFPLEKTYTDKWNQKKDGYNEGDTYDLVVYIECHMSDICSDGSTLDTMDSRTGSTAYGNSFAGNYLGKSLDEIEEDHDSIYSGWTKTDVK